MKPSDVASIRTMLRLHAAVGAMLRADRAYEEARGDIAREPSAFEARSAAKADVAEAYEMATMMLAMGAMWGAAHGG